MSGFSGERGGFVPQGEAFGGAKTELMGLGLSADVLSRAEQIQIGEDLAFGKDDMVLRREAENSYRVARAEDMDKQ